jgi:hypothetical protein
MSNQLACRPLLHSDLVSNHFFFLFGNNHVSYWNWGFYGQSFNIQWFMYLMFHYWFFSLYLFWLFQWWRGNSTLSISFWKKLSIPSMKKANHSSPCSLKFIISIDRISLLQSLNPHQGGASYRVDYEHFNLKFDISKIIKFERIFFRK